MAVDKQGRGADLATRSARCPRTRPRAAGSRIRCRSSSSQLAANPQVPLLDSIVPLKVALLYYQQLQAAFSGKTTPLKAMQNVDKGLESLNP